ncbi:HEAT repeat domain-containing protein [Natronorubrum sp. DTA7]|uniref:HEAT repeat domain-containing protein n=1 Tax=Natronorubrum sp. DTA7 TaxID=3447016 RepID=UPI003F8442E2
MTSQQDRSAQLKAAVQSKSTAIEPSVVEKQLTATGAADRGIALQAVSLLVRESPDQAVAFADRVTELLEDDVLAVRAAAALAAMSLAEHRPESIHQAIPSLVELLDEDPPLLRFRAAGALAPLTDSHPETFSDHVDSLVRSLRHGPRFETDLQSVAQSSDLTAEQKTQRLSVLKSRTDELERGKIRSAGTREVIVNTLVEVTRVDPEACTAHRSDLVAALSDDDPAVRAGAVEIVRHLADADPAFAEQTVDPLLTRLEDEAAFARARAVRALGFLEATDAIDPLSELARHESNAELAELAADTADWLGSVEAENAV